MSSPFTGIYPAFYACYDERGAISPRRSAAFAEHLCRAGVQGLYVNGSSGECIYLDVEERMQVLESVMDAVGGKVKVICHVACNNTRDSRRLAAHAERLGVDAIAAIPPIYFHLPEEAIAAYWNDISAAAPHTPFIIYNIPQLAGVALTLPLLRTMLRNPMVRGVKNSSMPTQDIQMFKTAGGTDFTVFNGPDEQYIGGRIMGADAGIGGTYAAMPELFLRAEALLRRGDLAAAQAVQFHINEIIYALCSARGNMYAVIKAVLAQRHGLALGGVREPLMNLQPGDEQAVARCCHLIDSAVLAAQRYDDRPGPAGAAKEDRA